MVGYAMGLQRSIILRGHDPLWTGGHLGKWCWHQYRRYRIPIWHDIERRGFEQLPGYSTYQRDLYWDGTGQNNNNRPNFRYRIALPRLIHDKCQGDHLRSCRDT